MKEINTQFPFSGSVDSSIFECFEKSFQLLSQRKREKKQRITEIFSIARIISHALNKTLEKMYFLACLYFSAMENNATERNETILRLHLFGMYAVVNISVE